jgi:hypothetical protein
MDVFFVFHIFTMPISNVFIYIFTAIEIGFTQSQQLVGLLHFWITLVLLAYSLGG